MRNRNWILAGTALPLLLSSAAWAQQPEADKPIIIAQNVGEEQQTDEQILEEQQAEEQAAEEQAAEEQPAEEQAAEEQPAEEQAVEEQPAEEQAAEEQPAEEQAAEEQPAEEQAVEEQPAEEQAAEEQPAEEQPAEEQAAEEQPAEEQAAEEQAAEEQPAEEQAAEEQPAEEQPAEEQAAEEQPAEEQPAEEQAAEEQPAEEQAAEEQPAEEQASDQQPAEDQAAEEESTVEQQLEAQGDSEEAEQVRELRGQLVDELSRGQRRGRRDDDEGGAQEDTASDDSRDAAQEDDGERTARGDGRRRDRRGERLYDRDDARGRIVEERGGRLIIDLGGGQIYVEAVVPDEGGRLLHGARDIDVEELSRGRTRTIVRRRNGVDIITVRDRYGDIIRRSKRFPNGREIILIDNRFDGDRDRRRRRAIRRDVRGPQLDRIPRDRYIIDLGRADRRQIRDALLAPPIEEIEEDFTLDEVLLNEQIRAYAPRVDLDTITFDFGSATIGDSQMDALYELGEVLEEIVAESPGEVYLIEGHTDAVGSDYDNLILSDQRAEAVAVALSQNFDIPPENLVTEGYGEQYLKVETAEAERRNRRATVRRLTQLMAQAQN